jgi:drug/metabolite transporter (DMT)-like permease
MCPGVPEWPLLAVTAFGVIVGFPLFLALALRHVPSTHGAVVTALLPLSTAVLGALWYRQRPSNGFWACAVVGSTLVLGFMVWRAGGVYLGAANIYLLIAMTTGALGYIGGARLTPRLGAEQVICWVLVCCLPLTLPMAWWFAPSPASAIHASSWMGFAYVSLFSMWIGFFAWYRALALGAVRVSQLQLVQPFLEPAVCRAPGRRAAGWLHAGFRAGRDCHGVRRQKDAHPHCRKTGMNPHVADNAAPHQPTAPGPQCPRVAPDSDFFR